ncbi:hypothetical protein HPB50_013579 [Hyalomma asiaticum]|uniref:Uncharacterized protein n=1 Tax=Hyalomma asiaticum TaxID=266040 RepID=A0ACB7T7M6_HYAAI|nr:hypothetical protein HPB50_013579 [Hyalomma asiaticum]
MVQVTVLPGARVRRNGTVSGLRLPRHVKRASGDQQRRRRLQSRQGQLNGLPGAHVRRNGTCEWSPSAEALRITSRRPVPCEHQFASSSVWLLSNEVNGLPRLLYPVVSEIDDDAVEKSLEWKSPWSNITWAATSSEKRTRETRQMLIEAFMQRRVFHEFSAVENVVGRDPSLVEGAARLVTEEQQKHYAEALEIVRSDPGLLERVQELTYAGEKEAVSGDKGSLRSFALLARFMRVEGVMMDGVTCDMSDGRPDATVGPIVYCLAHIRQYLKLGDIRDVS